MSTFTETVSLALEAHFASLLVFLFVLLVLRQVRSDVQPIFTNVIGGVALGAKSNAAAFAMAIGFGLSASLQVATDEATKLNWVILAAACKVTQPFIAGCVAYATQNKFSPSPSPAPAPAPKTLTVAPFPPTIS